MNAILFLLVLFAQDPKPATQPASLEEINARGRAAIDDKDVAGAEQVFREGLNQAKLQGDRKWEAEFQRAIGETYHRRGQLKEAVTYYEASLEVQKARGDQPGTAFLLRGIGDVYRMLREDAKAESFLEQARSTYTNLGAVRDSAIATQILAQLKIAGNKQAEASALLKQAIGMFDGIGDKSNAAVVRDDLATIYLDKEDYRGSLDLVFQALEIQRTLPNDVFLPVTYERLGNAFLRMEQPEKALGYYRQCLDLRLKNNRNLLATAQAYNNIGYTLEKIGQYKEAIETLSKALEIRQGRDSPEKVIETLINMSNAQVGQGDIGAAESSLNAALKLAEQRKSAEQVAMSLYGLGNIAITKSQLDSAIAQHTRALNIRRDLGKRIEAVHSMNRLALAYEMKGDLAQSEKFHAAALDDFETIAKGITDPAQVGRFRASTIILYPHYARVLVKQGKTEEGLAIVERSRGAGLARMAEINRRGFLASLNQADRSAWIAAEAAKARATNQLRDALAAPAKPLDLEIARANFLRAENSLEQLRDSIYARTPGLVATANVQPDVRKLVAYSRNDPKTLYLEWIMVEDSSPLLFAVSGGEVHAFELAQGRRELSLLARRWRASFERGSTVRGVSVATTVKVTPAAEAEAARQLYSAVFGPVAERLDSGNWARIVLIPDGPLLDLAFAGLMNSHGRRLIENLPVTTAVSLESVMAGRGPNAASGTLLAIGDPIEPGEQRLVAPSGDRFEPLANARAEAQTVAGLFRNSVVYTGGQAREARVKEEIGKYRMIHFATHGVLSQSEGLDSGLLLANELADSREDGLLQAWEIADMRLSADLAVLSACETAEGGEQLGEGLMGLAWAFQAAGCPNVIASLWNIDDETTQAVMVEFYKAVRDGKRIDEALQKAMLAVKAGPRTASPYYWAGFRILGPAWSLAGVGDH